MVRAKRKPYIPVVLSRKEIETVLKHLASPFDLVVKLLYGCGLRLFECLGLRVHCLNLDAGILTVHVPFYSNPGRLLESRLGEKPTFQDRLNP